MTALTAPALNTPSSQSLGRRAAIRFWANRRGRVSLIIFLSAVFLSFFAELLSNDRPLIVSFEGELYSPLVYDYPESTFGGDFRTATDYLDPFIRKQFDAPGNWALYPINEYSYETLNYFASQPNPAPPSSENWMGTDDRGRDIAARLLFGFRVSVFFGLALTAVGVLLGIFFGALQGYFVGKTDLFFQRVIEVWGAIPELYLLIILASIFEPGLLVLLVILSLFGLRYSGSCSWPSSRSNYSAPCATQQLDPGDCLFTLSYVGLHSCPYKSRLSWSWRSVLHAQSWRTACAGERQSRRLVDHSSYFCRACGHTFASYFHRRGAARRA